MRRILAQTRKELTQIVRDWRTLLLALILPLILLMLLGNAISLSVTDMPIVVQDLDDSPSSRELIDKVLSMLGHPTSYREHRFAAANGSTPVLEAGAAGAKRPPMIWAL